MNQQSQAERGVMAPSVQSSRQREAMPMVVSSAIRAASAGVFAMLVAMPFTPSWAQGGGGSGNAALGQQGARASVDPDGQDGLGSATHALLALQVSGAAAGPQQPMTGDATSAAYKRYTDSFSHAVPEFFQQKVRSDSSGS